MKDQGAGVSDKSTVARTNVALVSSAGIGEDGEFMTEAVLVEL